MSTHRVGPSTAVVQPTYDEQPALFDQLTFRNREVEDEARNAFEQALTAAVRRTDDLLTAQAREMSTEVMTLVSEARTAAQELRDMELDLRDGRDIDREAWTRLDRVADQLAAALNTLLPRFQALSERLDDPLTYASELQRRFPALHRPVFLPAQP